MNKFQNTEGSHGVFWKIARFKRPRGKSFRPVLVYDGNISPRLETEGYFDVMLPFSKLMGL